MRRRMMEYSEKEFKKWCRAASIKDKKQKELAKKAYAAGYNAGHTEGYRDGVVFGNGPSQ